MKQEFLNLCRMKFYKMIEKINNLFYQRYHSLEPKSGDEKIVVNQNTINNGKLDADLLLLEGDVEFVNKGEFKGIIIAKNANIYNYGVIEGVIFCRNGICSFKEASKTVGIVHCHKIVLQVGCSIEGEIFWGNELKFAEALKEKVSTLDADDILGMIENYCE